MIRSLTLGTAALALTALVGPASAVPAPVVQRGVSVAVQKDKANDAVHGEAWENASPASRRAADLRRVTVGDSPRGSKYMRFTWKTDVLQKRRPDVARSYHTKATTPETDARVEVRLVQVNKCCLEAFLFVNGDTNHCLYAKGAPPVMFNTRSDTVSLDIRTACLKAATNGEVGLRLGHATVSITRERASKDRVIGGDTAPFKHHPQVNF